MTELVAVRNSALAGSLEVRDDGVRRSLWFGHGLMQSEILLDRPGELPNPVSRAMLAHLMFGRTPERVLLAGCGGGGIARWFDARSPRTGGCAVEIDPDVARLAREFFEFPERSGRWHLEVGDVREHVAGRPDPYDFILVDIEADGLRPDWTVAPDFLQRCRAALTANGVLTLNLLVDGPEMFLRSLQSIRACFERRVLCLPVPSHTNVMIMAFAAPPDLAALERALTARSKAWGLEFDRFLSLLRDANPDGSGIF